MPSFKNFTSINAFHLQPFPYELIPLDAGTIGLNPQQGNVGSVAGIVDDVLQAGRSAAHFQAHVKSLRHFQFLHHVFQLFTGHVHGSVRPQRFGKTQAEIIDVRNNHRLGSGLLADGGSHAADNPGSRNQDVLAHQIPGQSRMDGVAQRVKNGGDFHRNALVDAHHVILRNGKVLRKAAGPVDSHTLCVGTQVLLP